MRLAHNTATFHATDSDPLKRFFDDLPDPIDLRCEVCACSNRENVGKAP